MGQKTHLNGFRTGVNKLHSATWFANYSAYSEVLKDYKIRTLYTSVHLLEEGIVAF